MLATVLVLSTLDVSEADARKRKINVVQCSTQTGFTCEGTDRKDRLYGKNQTNGAHEVIRGKEGNDIYDDRGGIDSLEDASTTSSDSYLFSGASFGPTDQIVDAGGSSDKVDLSQTTFRLFDNTAIRKTDFDGDTQADDLEISGPEGTVYISDHFGSGKMETINFANATVSY
jgi:hypothetical protein